VQAPLIPAPLPNCVDPGSKYQEQLNFDGRELAQGTQLQPSQQQITSESMSGSGMKSNKKRRPNSYNEFQRQSNNNVPTINSQVDLGQTNQATALYQVNGNQPGSIMQRQAPNSGKNTQGNSTNLLGLRNSSQQMMPPINFVPTKGGQS
jgi:hypothetical protein